MRHLNFSGEEILETINMVRTEQLDIRTITVGISLFDCVSDSCDGLCRNVYDKVERVARDLRRVSAEISQEFGLPIINNRIAVTPVSLIAGRSGRQELLRIAETLDRAAHAVNVDFIGGFSAQVEKGMTQIDANLFAAIPEALAATKRVCASVNVGSTRAGLNMDAIADIGRIIKRTAELTGDGEFDRLRQARRVLQCGRGQSVHGRSVSRRQRARVRRQCRGQRPRRRAQGHQGGRRRRFRHAGFDHSPDRVQDHPRRRAGRANRRGPIGAAVRHRRSVAGANSGRGRQRRADIGGNRIGQRRHARLDGGARAAQRRREEGRRHGVELCRRTFRRLHPAVGRRGNDRSGANAARSPSTSSKP